jgi:sugar fermentation stimulation protein A
MTSSIKIDGQIVKGIFQERPNRFLTLVRINDKISECFLPDPGRLNELLKPGIEVLLKKILKDKRKTSYDLIAVYNRGKMVSIDSRVPNKLIFKALKNKDIKELSEYDWIKPEFSYANSRFDFLLKSKYDKCLLEVKSCTLIKDKLALFPDAPTKRGKRHVIELLKAKKEGYRACIIFLVQRDDAKIFTTNNETDPDFGIALRNAFSQGVEVYAYSSILINNKIILKDKIKVELL